MEIIGPFFIKLRKDGWQADLSPVGGDPQLQAADAVGGYIRQAVHKFVLFCQDLYSHSVKLLALIGESQLWLPVEQGNTVMLFQTLDMLA